MMINARDGLRAAIAEARDTQAVQGINLKGHIKRLEEVLARVEKLEYAQVGHNRERKKLLDTIDKDSHTIANAFFQLDYFRRALEDMLSGWRYIRQVHGDLYGVGWDRAQSEAEGALKAWASAYGPPADSPTIREWCKCDAPEARFDRERICMYCAMPEKGSK